MSLLNWFKPLSQASAEGGIEQPAVSLSESQDSSQSTTAESAGIEQPLIESRDHSHYVQENDTVLCFYCATAVQRKLRLGGYVETNFTYPKFHQWE